MLPRRKILSWECVPPVSHQVSEGDMLPRLKILSWECVPPVSHQVLGGGACCHAVKSYCIARIYHNAPRDTVRIVAVGPRASS